MSSDKNITFAEYTDQDYAFVIDSHRRIFREEYGWGEQFVERVVEIVNAYANRQKSARETFLIAKCGDKPIGSMMLIEVPGDPTVAQLRLLVVEPEYRGHRVGSRLMRTLLQKAINDQYDKVILWTVNELIQAREYYAKLGFQCTETEVNTLWHPDGSPVIEEKWELALTDR